MKRRAKRTVRQSRTKEHFARKPMGIAAKFCSRRRTKENFTRKSMGLQQNITMPGHG